MFPSAAELVARYLRSSGYEETLAKFIEEAGLKPDAGSGNGITIDQILDEKRAFDLSIQFEKLGTDEDSTGWRSPAPSSATILESVPTRSNILSASVQDLLLPGSEQPTRCIAATTADRRINLLDAHSSPPCLLKSYSHFQDSPLLDLAVIGKRFLLAGSMSGKLILYNTATDKVIGERRDHTKYLVQLATWNDLNSTLIASAGWDAKVHVYRLDGTDGDHAQLGEPLTTLTLPTVPESISFLEAPGRLSPVLLVARRDSTNLYYYDVVTSDTGSVNLALLGKQNLAPHSTAWIVFSPSDVQLCPTDSSIAAVATSSTPHMKLLIVRLVVPPAAGFPAQAHGSDYSLTDATTRIPEPDDSSPPLTQAAQTRAELQLQDREEAAILISINTMAPQTAYSTPRLVWRPDGSGIYVTSDDGIVRGFEAKTGKLIKSLDAHDSGSKIRCLWAGYLEGSVTGGTTNGSDCLLSGGFDQKLILWRAA